MGNKLTGYYNSNDIFFNNDKIRAIQQNEQTIVLLTVTFQRNIKLRD